MEELQEIMELLVQQGVLVLVREQIMRVTGGVVFVQINVLEVVEEVTVVQGGAEDMEDQELVEEQEEMVVRLVIQKVGQSRVLPQLRLV